MNLVEALNTLATFTETDRQEAFDVVCVLDLPDGGTHDAWPEAALALLDATGLLDEPRDREGLRLALVDASGYVSAEIITLDQVRAEAVDLLNRIMFGPAETVDNRFLADTLTDDRSVS